MHVLIMTDMEGVSCVDTMASIAQNTEAYRNSCVLLTQDTNAAIAGAFDGGADRVSVVDGHGTGINFVPGMLDPRAEQIPASTYKVMDLNGIDALMSIGAHAMAGTEKAFLDHTQSSLSWFDYQIGGVSYGELGQQAMAFGAFGIPLVMVSGDEAACREARTLAANCACAVVKTALCRNRADCLPQEEALQRIRDAAADGVRRCREIAPFKIALPAEYRLTFTRNDYCDDVMHEGLKRSGRTVTKTLEKITCCGDVLWP